MPRHSAAPSIRVMNMPLLSYAFRPFFLLAAAFSIVTLGLWLFAFHGVAWTGTAFSPWWHAHEMGLGFGGAVVAGFLLTAIATWTGRPPIRGGLLAMLVLAWLAGRLAMSLPGILPPAVIAAADLLFPVMLAVLAGREIVAGGSRRNYGIAVLVWIFVAVNLLYHAGAERTAVYLFIHLLALLITVIGGRVVPNFTANWLRSRGAGHLPVSRRPVEAAVLPLTAAAGLAASFLPGSTLSGITALAAGIANAVRLAGWRGFDTVAEPLVFVLHAAYAWLAVGYILIGAAAFGWGLPATAGLHALTVGGIGGMILAMMTRVSLGHTGRPLHAARLTVLGYLLLGLAALLRAGSPLAGEEALRLIDLSAAAWISAFVLFLWVYLPVLTTPRLDAGGRAGS